MSRPKEPLIDHVLNELPRIEQKQKILFIISIIAFIIVLGHIIMDVFLH